MEARKRKSLVTPEIETDVRYPPSCQSASTVVPVSNQRGETEGQQENHEPEETTVRLEAWANMWRASVESYALFTTGVWDLSVSRAFVPVVIIALAGVIVW